MHNLDIFVHFLLVAGQVAFDCGLVLALVAFVRPVFCVSSHVNLEIFFPIGCIIADFALEWLFSRVDSKIIRQMMFLAECFVTEGAFVFFFVLVDFLVSVSIGRLREGLPTISTGVGLDLRMCAQMI